METNPRRTPDDPTWNGSQKAELEFWEQGAHKYGHFSRQYWDKELDNYLGHVGPDDFKGQRVLEIGCGPKGMIHYIDAAEKVGVEPLVAQYERLGILEDGGVEHVEGVGENLEFPDGAFDRVICFNVLDHSRDPSTVCREIHRVLNEQGLVVFHSHFIARVFRPVRFLLERVDKPHPWHFTLPELRGMFADAGLTPSFDRVTGFHWKAQSLVRQVAATTIIRNYFAVLRK